MAKDQPRPGCRRAITRTTAAVLLLAVLTAAFLLTGWPQHRAIEWTAGRILGANVEVEGRPWTRGIHLNQIRVYESPAHKAAENPAIVIDDLTIAFRVLPEGGRHVDELAIANLRLNLDERTETPNFAFLRRFLQDDRPPTENNRFLPRRIDIQSIDAQWRTPRLDTALHGVRLDGTVTSPQSFALEFFGHGVGAHWRALTSGDGAELGAGFLRATINRDHAGIHATILAGLPGIADIDGRIGITLEPALTRVAASAETLRLYGTALPAVTQEYLPFPLQFDVMNASGFTLATTLGPQEPLIPAMTLHAQFQNLLAGTPENALYNGNLTLNAAIERGEDITGEVTAVLNEGQALWTRLAGHRQHLTIEGRIDEWSRAETLAAAPAAFRPALENTSFDQLAGTFQLDMQDTAYTVNAQIQSQGAGNDTEAIQFALNGSGNTQTPPLFDGALHARLGPGQITLTAHAAATNQYRAETLLEAVQLRPWLAFGAAANLPEALEATAAGTITLDATREDAPAALAANLALTPFTLGDFTFEQMDLNGAAQWDLSQSTFTSANLTATAGETTSVHLTAGRYNLKNRSGSAQVEATIDAAILARAFGQPELYGELHASAPLNFAGDSLTSVLSLRTGYLGHGNFAVPYGSEWDATATLAYDLATRQGLLTEATTGIGQGTRATSQRTEFSLDPFTLAGPFTITSDLKIFVEMAYLPRAGGSATATGQFDMNQDSGFRATFDGHVTDASFALPNNIGTVQGMTFTGSGAYENGLSGSGNLTAEGASAAGATVHNPTGMVFLQGNTIRAGGVTGTVFNGEIIADVVADLAAEGLPINLGAQFNNVDLAQLTEEIQPPRVKLTGIAHGGGSLLYQARALRDFTLTARSEEQFSINREIVEEALNLDRLDSLPGGRRVTQNVQRELLGTQPQRPFDTARLHLRLEAGRIRGEAVLKNERTRDYRGLDLTIDLAVDPAALAEGFKLLEDSASTLNIP